jgi:adenylate kinase
MANGFVAITGTPGTGKTSTSRLLVRTMGWKHVDLGRLALRAKLLRGYDWQRKVPVVDLRRIRGEVIRIRRITGPKVIVLDGCYSHLIGMDKDMPVVVLRCEPDRLARRLRVKGWGEQKIRENVQSEILGVIESEALRRYRRVCEIDTTGRTIGDVCDVIVALYGKGFPRTRPIDWLSKRTLKRRILRWMV